MSNKKDSRLESDQKNFLSNLTKPGNPAEEIILKDPKTWTHDEMMLVKKHLFHLSSNDPKSKHMEKQVGKWFSHVYSDKPAQLDATGRMIDPKPVNPPPKKPTALLGKDGIDLKTGIERVGAKTVGATEEITINDAIKSLQGGINLIGHWNKAEKNNGKSSTPIPLKEDGVLGPKTKTALKQSVATLGTAKTEDAQALGGFHLYTKDGKKEEYKDLANKMNVLFGPLFRDPTKPLDKKAIRHESLALQDTVNHFGEKKFGRNDWKTVNDDGWIGPITTKAFSKIAKSVNPDRLTRRLGSNLGFL